MEVQIISRETIKPSSATPSHLSTLKLSLLDQLTPSIYLPMLLFYPNSNPRDCQNKTPLLKTSLAHTLSRYYPFAGRLADMVSVDCNDEGIDFLEARVDCELSDLLTKPEPEKLDSLYPTGVLWNDKYKGSPIIIQVSYFSCGGMAIGWCMLHKIADGGAVSAFIRDWAARARNLSSDTRDPEFFSRSLPTREDSLTVSENKIIYENCVTRRFVLGGANVARLKASVTESGVQNPTRVEVVTSLIFLRATAANQISSGQPRPAVLLQPVNIRPRLSPPLPENSIGNLSWFFTVMPRDDNDKNLHQLVDKMKKGMTQFVDKYTKDKTAFECYSIVCDAIKEASEVLSKSDNIDVYKSSSLCRYPFNQMDFGWGEPIWVGISSSKVKNTFLLTDSKKDGGIEAWITLEREAMAELERDEELLSFACLNPSVIDTN